MVWPVGAKARASAKPMRTQAESSLSWVSQSTTASAAAKTSNLRTSEPSRSMSMLMSGFSRPKRTKGFSPILLPCLLLSSRLAKRLRASRSILFLWRSVRVWNLVDDILLPLLLPLRLPFLPFRTRPLTPSDMPLMTDTRSRKLMLDSFEAPDLTDFVSSSPSCIQAWRFFSPRFWTVVRMFMPAAPESRESRDDLEKREKRDTVENLVAVEYFEDRLDCTLGSDQKPVPVDIFDDDRDLPSLAECSEPPWRSSSASASATSGMQQMSIQKNISMVSPHLARYHLANVTSCLQVTP
mmetsp:Transcript_81512/g.253293  ORF Transcript_81512/g.253293 Transcript_81512/m.253293 type:complete len:296 (+) Transcript_81512:906-1793(+)